MNIVLVGSCTDSSILAKELNKRLHDSIVARVDLLRDIKQLVLQDLNVNTTENIGAYVGDVETFDYSKVNTAQRAEILATIESITKNISSLKNGKIPGPSHVNTFDALTKSLPTGTYSFIKVYSGVVDDARVTSLMRENNFLSNAIFVVIKAPQNALLPITVTQPLLEIVKKEAFAFVEVDKVEDVLTSEVFKLLFELSDEPTKETAKEIKEAEPEPVHGFLPPQDIEVDFMEMPEMAMAA
jgi:hypothetical protein